MHIPGSAGSLTGTVKREKIRRQHTYHDNHYSLKLSI